MIPAETRSKCAKGYETEKDEAFLRKGKKTQASRRVDEGKKWEMRSPNWLECSRTGGRCHRVLLSMTRTSDVIPSEPRSH